MTAGAPFARALAGYAARADLDRVEVVDVAVATERAGRSWRGRLAYAARLVWVALTGRKPYGWWPQ